MSLQRVRREQRDAPAPTDRSGGSTLRIAYVMSRFPKLSETFVLNEMLAMRRQGVEIAVYPLVLERATVVHPEARALVAEARVARPLSLATGAALLHYLRHDPRGLAAACALVVRRTAAARRSFLANLATIPRAAWMAREMERAGVAHIHAHFASSATTAAFIVHRLTGIPYSFTAHAQDIFRNQRMLAEKIDEAAFAVTISEFNRRFIADAVGERLGQRVRVIHCGVDTDVFRCDGAPRQPGPLRIVCVGRLTAMKGQRHLIEACRLLHRAGVPFHCSIIGVGPDRDDLLARIASAGIGEQVALLGAQPRDAVLAAVRGADVVVLPSVVTADGRMDGIPVALMEAMACERAVIGSRISGIPELIEDGVSGRLVEPGDAAGLAAALTRLEQDPELRERLGQAGRARVVAEFDLATTTASLRSQIEATFEAAARAGAGRR